jgi:hypothetical protein
MITGRPKKPVILSKEVREQLLKTGNYDPLKSILTANIDPP